MKNCRYCALTAGILYLQFVVFSAAVLWLWLGDTPWRKNVELLPTIPGAVELLAVITVLMAASLMLGSWLTIRATVNRVVLVGGVLTAIVAIWWNVLALAFWIAPLPFMWISFKARHDG